MNRLARIERHSLTIIGIVLAIVCFFSVNLFAALRLGSDRLDLTENHLYTLSDGTKSVLSTMKEPVTLRFYVSKALTDAEPGIKPYAVRVREMLDTYAKLAQGRIRVELINPEPFSPEEDRAAGFGLRGVPYDSQGSRGYFGIVGTNTTDDTDSIAFLAPNREAFLEYDLTRLINNLAHPEKPVVALIDGIGMTGGPQTNYRPWQIYAQMRQIVTMRVMAGDIDKIGDDVQTLVLVHPHDLSDKTLYAIDQFVLRGGHALVFIDPLAEAMMRNAQMGMPPQGTASNLDRLLKAWGVEMVAGQVVGDGDAAIRVQAQSGGRDVVTQYLPWLRLGSEALAKDDVISGQLQELRFLSAGALKPVQGATTTLTPLVQSSIDSELIDAGKLMMMPDPVQLINDFKPSGERYVLAARVSGPVKTAFPDGAPPAAKTASDEATANNGNAGAAAANTPAAPGLKESAKPVNLILVADADLLSDDAWLNVQSVGDATLAVPTANNADFVLNALENLSGSEALIGLRGRGLSDRPFTTVDRLRDAADAKYRATEQQLTTQLADVQQQLASLQPGDKAGDQALLTPEQQETIRKFRTQVLTIRTQLRDVEHALNQDIDRLQTQVMLANIGAVPVLVALAALAVALVRRTRARRRRGAAT